MQKFSRTTAVIATVALAGALGACAEQPRYGSQYPASQPTYSSYPQGAPAPAGMEYGTVTNIETLQGRSSGSSVGVGTVAGAVIGGVLGNQVGKGTGRAAATVLGAVGGGVVGNQIEGRTGNNNDGRIEGYRITIQLDQGGQRAYDVGSPGDLRPGDRVRLNGGQISRM